MGRGSALITGASSGIGAELAKLCAGGGYDVVLVARRAAQLEKLAGDLAARHSIQPRVLAADLSEESAPDQIAHALNGRIPDLLINNAGFGIHGPFSRTDWTEERRLIEVNMIAPVRLSKLLVPKMLERGSGRILNVASTAAFVPGPLMAMYYASKSFLVSFSLAVARELKGSGVSMTVLCPGPTRTEFGEVAGLQSSRLFQGPAMSAEAVAREGFDAMLAGKDEIIAGARNRWLILGSRLAPRSMLAAMAQRLNSSVK